MIQTMPNLKRMRNKHQIRAALVAVHGCKCVYCGRDLDGPTGLFTIEHVVPRFLGGTNELPNLRPACDYCNSLHVNPLEVHLRPKKQPSYLEWRWKIQWKAHKKEAENWQAPCLAIA